jgi:hypothetical protein
MSGRRLIQSSSQWLRAAPKMTHAPRGLRRFKK